MKTYDSAMREASRSAFDRLMRRHEHVSFAESLTGGLIVATLIANAGASEVLNESYVTYSYESKMRILGVHQQTLSMSGVVSAHCAREMAAGVRSISGADWGVSATGLAGPSGGSSDTPVGTVYIGVANLHGAQAHEFHFSGSRDEVRMQAVRAAFIALCRAMDDQKD